MIFNLVFRLLFTIFLVTIAVFSAPALFFVYVTFKEIPKADPSKIITIENDYKFFDSIVRQRDLNISTGISLHVHEAGNIQSDKLIIFVHGFPESGSVSWKFQIPYFVEKGYFVVAPDNRGYGLSQSEAFSEYMNCNHEQSARDIKALIEFYGRKSAIVVGHDWGAGAVFEFSSQFPEYVEKVVILNMLHPQLFSVHPWKMFPYQILKSWYIFYNQITGLSEDYYLFNDASVLEYVMLTNNHTVEDVARLKKVWKIPGAMRSMLNWYRFPVRHRTFNKKPVKMITKPLIMFFGKADMAIEWSNAVLSVEKPFVENGKIVLYENVGHWIQHEAADRVNADILNFIK